MKKKNLLFLNKLQSCLLVFVILVSFGACKEEEEIKKDYIDYLGDIIFLKDAELDDKEIETFFDYYNEFLGHDNIHLATLRKFDKIYSFPNYCFPQPDKIFFTKTDVQPDFYINILMPQYFKGKIYNLYTFSVEGYNLASLFKFKDGEDFYYVTISSSEPDYSNKSSMKWFVNLFEIIRYKNICYVEKIETDGKFEKAMSGVRKYEDFLKAWKKYKS